MLTPSFEEPGLLVEAMDFSEVFVSAWLGFAIMGCERDVSGMGWDGMGCEWDGMGVGAGAIREGMGASWALVDRLELSILLRVRVECLRFQGGKGGCGIEAIDHQPSI